MKRSISMLAASVFMLPLAVQSQTFQAQSGVSLLTSVTATATHTGAAIRLPNFSGVGTLNITESGITGSPSGCSVALAYQQNNATVKTAAVATIAFTPATGTQQLSVIPTVPSGDNYIAVYSCSSTYPTAGLISVSFSPIATNVLANVSGVGDPCKNPAAATSSFSVALTSATTTAVAAVAAGKSVYVCQMTIAGTTGGSVQLEYGTGATCGTGTTALTGAIAVTTAQPVSVGWGGALVTAPVGNALCLVTSGTSTAVNGFISYVQQ
jgi:hypothetical protein